MKKRLLVLFKLSINKSNIKRYDYHALLLSFQPMPIPQQQVSGDNIYTYTEMSDFERR